MHVLNIPIEEAGMTQHMRVPRLCSDPDLALRGVTHITAKQCSMPTYAAVVYATFGVAAVCA